MVDEKMRRLLNKCTTHLNLRMTPDDLAGIMKEKRGIKIPKTGGGIFDHIGEWEQVRSSFKKTFNGPLSGSLEEVQFLSERFGDLNRLWDMFEGLIEESKCNPDIQ